MKISYLVGCSQSLFLKSLCYFTALALSRCCSFTLTFTTNNRKTKRHFGGPPAYWKYFSHSFWLLRWHEVLKIASGSLRFLCDAVFSGRIIFLLGSKISKLKKKLQ